MYLLKPFRYSQQLLKYLYSHSTMYLLKRISITSAYRNKVLFTFHHVSIKTLVAKHYCKVIISFTFHHVSIKTYKTAKADYEKKYSHSTMYLLKRPISFTMISSVVFTFHHVSIKTKKLPQALEKALANSHSTMYLLKLSLS